MQPDTLCAECAVNATCPARGTDTRLVELAEGLGLTYVNMDLTRVDSHPERCQITRSILEQAENNKELVALVRAKTHHDDWLTGSCFIMLVAGREAARKLGMIYNHSPMHSFITTVRNMDPQLEHHITTSFLCEMAKKSPAGSMRLVDMIASGRPLIAVVSRVDTVDELRPPD
jgi:hypothetical protein